MHNLMEIDKLPFKIGMHYENWELDLIVEELCSQYELYRYVKGDIVTFKNYEVTDIFLYFSFDILFQVELFMEQGDLPFAEFHEVENGLSLRAVKLPESGLIQLTYNKDKIWRDIL